MDLDLHGRSVLVTGASRGLGREIALWFAREGARVAICARSATALDAVAAEITDTGARAHAMVADLFQAEDCARVVAETAEEFGGLDVLVGNASTDVSGHGAGLANVTDEQLLERVMGKALATIRCARAALPHLRESAHGRVICIGGDAARTTYDPFADSRRSNALAAGLGNAMLVNFAKRLSNEVGADGITVNVVHPSGNLTGDRYDERVRRFAAKHRLPIEEAEAQLRARTPINRGVCPADIAPMIVFLASRHAGALTGQSITIDGGLNPAVIY